MARVPRDIKQDEAIRAFVRAGAVERKAKRGHRALRAANGALLSLPSGTLKVGLLEKQIKRAGMTIQEFLELL